jgi:hypothetical protein
MSTPLLKLYKGSYTNEQLLAKCTEGAIVFDNSTHRIYAGTADNTPMMFGSNVQDASFANSVLKIWKVGDAANSPSITLDFSDIASASAMMAVFQALYEKMGLTGQDHDQIDYSGTNYLSDLGTSGHPDKNLVNADKALDAAIKDVADAIDDLDVTEYEQATVDTTTSQTETTVKIKSIKEVDGKIEAGTATTDLKLDGTYDATNNKIATESTVETAVTKEADSQATYDTTATEISQDWIDVVEDNVIEQGDTFEEDIDKLDNKIAGLADELIKDEQVINQTVSTLANSIGLENDLSLDLSDDQSGIIDGDTDVKSALLDLAEAVGNAGDVDDVQINGTSIVDNKEANIAVDGTYNSSTNKIATESTVTNAIEALDSVADADDTEAQTGHATITTTTPSADFKVLNSVTEQDGKLTAADAYLLKKLAATGAAADVSLADSGDHFTATDVEAAFAEIATKVEALEGSFDVVKSTDAATTPAGVTWEDTSTTPATEVTGTLVASADTFHKIYLVPNGQSGKNSYSEYITTRTGSGTPVVYTYAWEKLGDIDIDLTGYAKTITYNNVQHSVTSNTTDIDLGTIVNDVTGETAITGGESGLVAVTPTGTTDANGNRTIDLDTTVKIEEVADGLTKDQTPSYTTGHYVIVNGKLVDASTASTGDTYTISANDGLVKASDVKAYVDSSVADSAFRWSEWS